MNAPAGRQSLRQRIDAKCRDCIFDECEAGRWRQQVAQCKAVECPLYDVRPQPRATDSD